MMTSQDTLGPAYTRGDSFRARAERRQREVRASLADAPWARYGHLLTREAADRGCNFVSDVAFEAALRRREAGKGVAERTFDNMLSSQAMCFNLFAPLAAEPELVATVLGRFIPGLARVRAMHIEYTPAAEIFSDQNGEAGVDCDVLVLGDWADGTGAVVVIETKLVEREFSQCGFRKMGRGATGRLVCPDDVKLGTDGAKCLYSSKKGYRYWPETVAARSIDLASLPPRGCPFGEIGWQLWVNHTLAHAEATRRGAAHAVFAVCAPAGNEALKAGQVVEGFSRVVRDPATVVFMPVDSVVDAIAEACAGRAQKYVRWGEGLKRRYAGI